MSQQDSNFNSQIFRKDNPIILACRRDQAVFMGVRVLYDAAGYLPGQVVARRISSGLFEKWSSVSGASYDSPVVLFDQCTNDDQLAVGDGSSTVQGASLLRAVMEGVVYTGKLIGYDAAAKAALGAKDVVDSGGVAMSSF